MGFRHGIHMHGDQSGPGGVAGVQGARRAIVLCRGRRGAPPCCPVVVSGIASASSRVVSLRGVRVEV